MPDVVRTCEMTARLSKEGWKWQGGLVPYPQLARQLGVQQADVDLGYDALVGQKNGRMVQSCCN